MPAKKTKRPSTKRKTARPEARKKSASKKKSLPRRAAAQPKRAKAAPKPRAKAKPVKKAKGQARTKATRASADAGVIYSDLRRSISEGLLGRLLSS